MEEKYEEIKKTLVKYNQEQLLVNYKNMNQKDKEKLLSEIENIDFGFISDIEDLDKDIESVLVKNEEYVLIVPRNHRLANEEEDRKSVV